MPGCCPAFLFMTYDFTFNPAPRKKMKHKKKKENIFTVAVIVGLIIFGTQHRRERKVFNKNLLKQASYSIGEYDAYEANVPSEGVKEEEKYLVLYN